MNAKPRRAEKKGVRQIHPEAEYKYVTIAVTPDTKRMVEERKEEMGAHTYDEALRVLAMPKGLGPLLELEGILKGTPDFVRDKRDRSFT